MLKRPKDNTWSPEDALDLDKLRSADWILTTYETLADNHRAFARIPYSVAVFDEMQKIKEPDLINTRSAGTLNVDFVLGLTGTPIENRFEDLCLIALHPAISALWASFRIAMAVSIVNASPN